MYLALVPGIFLALYLGLTIPIRYGRRWARVSVWFLAGLGLISLAAPVDSIVGTILTFTGAGIDFGVIVLLATKQSRALFPRRQRLGISEARSSRLPPRNRQPGGMAREHDVANESDRIDQRVRDHEGRRTTKSLIQAPEEQAHRGVADERPETLVQVVAAAYQRTDEQRPIVAPAQFFQLAQEIPDDEDLFEHGVLGG